MQEITKLKNYYQSLLVRPFTTGHAKNNSFSESFHKTATGKPGSVYTSLTTHSYEDRNNIMFQRSLELLNEYQDTFRKDVNELTIDWLCECFEKKFNIVPLSINREISLDVFQNKKDIDISYALMRKKCE